MWKVRSMDKGRLRKGGGIGKYGINKKSTKPKCGKQNNVKDVYIDR